MVRQRLIGIYAALTLILIAIQLFGFQNCSTPTYTSHSNLSSTVVPPASSSTPASSSASDLSPLTCNDLLGQDPYACQVVLGMHFEGTAGSTNFIDSFNRHPVAAGVGNPTISSVQSMFGNGSLILDGASYLTLPPSSDWDLSSSDATIEAWIMPTAVNNRSLISQSPTTFDQQWWFGFSGSGLYGQLNGGGQDIGGGSIVPNVWTHVAISKQSGVTMLFINGNQVASAGVNPFTLSSNLLYIGGDNMASYGNSYLFQGYMNDLRITKGVARYTANFSPPAAPFPSP